MTAAERRADPAAEHTAGARRAVAMNDVGGFIRHLLGWLYSITRQP